jgi:hypothetical protein
VIPGVRTRVSVGLAVFALLFGLAAAGAWLGQIGSSASGAVAFRLPLAFGRELNVSIWLLDKVATFWPDAPADFTPSAYAMAPNRGYLTLVLWYQDHAVGINRRLAILKLPNWPLSAMSALLAIASAWMWWRPLARPLAPATARSG